MAVLLLFEGHRSLPKEYEEMGRRQSFPFLEVLPLLDIVTAIEVCILALQILFAASWWTCQCCLVFSSASPVSIHGSQEGYRAWLIWARPKL